MNQTLKEIEIICVDDASPNNCYQILVDYQKQDERIKIYRHEENKGLCTARNIVIENALNK